MLSGLSYVKRLLGIPVSEDLCSFDDVDLLLNVLCAQ